MEIPNVDPEQYILFSSAEDSLGIGNFFQFQAKEIRDWINDIQDEDETEAIQVNNPKGGSDIIHFHDFRVMPLGWVPSGLEIEGAIEEWSSEGCPKDWPEADERQDPETDDYENEAFNREAGNIQ